MIVMLTLLQAATWTGAADDRWENAANWAPESVPGRETTVVVPAVERGPVLRRTAVVRRLMVEAGATLRIEGARTLFVTDTAEVAGAVDVGAGAVEVDGRLDLREGGRFGSPEEKPTGAIRRVEWLGAASSDWNDAANWSVNAVPLSTWEVIVPATDVPHWPVISTGSVGVGAIQIDGGTLTVAEPAALSIAGYFTVNGGTANLLGRSVDVNGSVTLAGGGLTIGEKTTVTVAGDWSGEVQTGTVVLDGARVQFLSSPATFHNLVIENDAVRATATQALGTLSVATGQLSFEPERAGERVWVGEADGDWNDPKNWSPEGVPGEEDVVVLRSDPVLTGEATVKGLRVESSGTLILRGGRLRVREDADLDGRVAYEAGGALEAGGLIVVRGAARVTGP